MQLPQSTIISHVINCWRKKKKFIIESDIWEIEKDLENIKKGVEEFKRRLSAKVKRQ